MRQGRHVICFGTLLALLTTLGESSVGALPRYEVRRVEPDRYEALPGALGWFYLSDATNDRIVGGTTDARAFLSQTNGLSLLPSGGLPSTGAGVSRHGVVAGSVFDAAARTWVPAIWSRGALRSGALPEGARTATATAVIDESLYAGVAEFEHGPLRLQAPFIWDGAARLGPGLLSLRTEVRCLNEVGVVVGAFISDDDNEKHAFVWHGDQIADLNERLTTPEGWRLASALSVNSRGVVRGQGTLFGEPVWFEATPVECQYDFNASGAIDTVDLSHLLIHWGNPFNTTDMARFFAQWGDCA